MGLAAVKGRMRRKRAPGRIRCLWGGGRVVHDSCSCDTYVQPRR